MQQMYKQLRSIEVQRLIADVPKLVEGALHTGQDPFIVLAGLVQVLGLPLADRSAAAQGLHEYLWEHRQELPWNVSAPTDK